MSALGPTAFLIALTAALLLVVLVLLPRSRRTDASIPVAAPPRTVADLVRHRAEQVAQAAVGPRDVADPMDAADPLGPIDPQDAAEQVADLPAVTSGVAGLVDRADPAPVPPRDVASLGLTADDAPWSRAAWMAVADEPEPSVEVAEPVVQPVVDRPVTEPVADRPLAEAVPAEAPRPAVREPAGPVHSRPIPADRATEQAAADLALLRTFGVDPQAACAPVVSFVHVDTAAEHGVEAASAQPVRFRVLRRGGAALAGAVVTVLDDRSREVAAGTADGNGCGDLQVPQPAGYVLLATAPGHQPGAVALTVDDAPIEVDVLLARSAEVSGTVRGEAGSVPGARVLLLQDGDLADTADCGADGAYRLGDLAAGEYCLSVTAPGCAPVVVELRVPEGADVRHDVVLEPAVYESDSDLVGARAGDG